jgi:hypothetical protein
MSNPVGLNGNRAAKAPKYRSNNLSSNKQMFSKSKELNNKSSKLITKESFEDQAAGDFVVGGSAKKQGVRGGRVSTKLGIKLK